MSAARGTFRVFGEALMMGSQDRVIPVQMEVEAAMRVEFPFDDWKRLPAEGENSIEIPIEQIRVELPAAGYDRVHEGSQLHGQFAGTVV